MLTLFEFWLGIGAGLFLAGLLLILVIRPKRDDDP